MMKYVIVLLLFVSTFVMADINPCIVPEKLDSKVISEFPRYSESKASKIFGFTGTRYKLKSLECWKEVIGAEKSFSESAVAHIYVKPLLVEGALCVSESESYKLEEQGWLEFFNNSSYSVSLPIANSCERVTLKDLVAVYGLVEDVTLSILLNFEQQIYEQYSSKEKPQHKRLSLRSVNMERRDSQTYYVFSYGSNDSSYLLYIKFNKDGRPVFSSFSQVVT